MEEISESPLSPEAADLLARINPRIEARLAEVCRVPVSVLIWGPGVDSSHPLAPLRESLRSTLRANGHAAMYSEELCDPELPFSVRMQQLAQAQEFDLIVSTPGTPGSIGEIHDFVADSRVNSKILLFLNEEYVDGYSNQSLMALQSVLTCQIESYAGTENASCIEPSVLDSVQRIREMKYLMAGRF